MPQELKTQGQAITIQTYEENWQNYISGTVSDVGGEFKEWMDQALNYVDKDSSKIFEVGSATGRDADYIQNSGYQITRSDVVKSFIDYQKSLGKEIIKFNVLDDIFPGKYDLIYANAVLLHFNPEELARVLENIKKGLQSGGLLAFTTKAGTGEEYSTHKMNKSRYFKYWQLEELKQLFMDLGYRIEVFDLSSDSKWIHGIVRFVE